MVSAISSISSASSMSASQALSAITKAKLEALGIDTSDIKNETDGQTTLKTIQGNQSSEKSSTKSVQDSEKASTLTNSQSSSSGPQWISLMNQLGISPTGSIDGDKAAITAAIANMDPAQASSVASQFQAVGMSVNTPNKGDNQKQADQFVGADQQAQLNKFFLVKQYAA